MILGEDGEKMSKSRGNVVNPDHVVEQYGADSLRCYEMFMGRLKKVKPWQTNGVKGVYSFLAKAFRFFGDSSNWVEGEEDTEVLKSLHQTIQKVESDTEEMRFNTAIAQMMIFTNLCSKKKKVTKKTAEKFTLILSAYAPHTAEEMWNLLGHSNSLAYEAFPSFDPELAKEDLVTIAIQVNGKMRGKLEVEKEISKEDFFAKAKAEPSVAKFMEGKNIVKEIFVPGKICNFVVK